ncbi:hypothetical protein PV328_001176 [Microctonus aethiopoides]|uniref:Uncharacterized protein n=1 Tax=Microctonus aethiopoides TaxID=144406 RepID=A0AA39FWE2_9HYME|nr:hypothetical protein PV328_001176 [Microctonus aethiopoides]
MGQTINRKRLQLLETFLLLASSSARLVKTKVDLITVKIKISAIEAQIMYLIKSRKLMLKHTRKMDKHGKIKIMNWNVNGITLKKYGLEDMLDRMRIDVGFITETKLSAKTKYNNFNNYNTYRNNRNTNKSGGGVMILLSKKYNNSELLCCDQKMTDIKAIETLAL